MKAQKFYKVRNMVDGLWMTNDTFRPVFASKGHLWKSIGTLRSFFTNLKRISHMEISPLWEVVEYDLQEVERYPAPAAQTPMRTKT